MRTAGTALSLLLLGACASTPNGNDAATSHAGTSNATTDDLQPIERGSVPAPTAGQDDLGQDGSIIALREQKAQFLFDIAMERARELKAQLKFDDALAQANQALEHKPTDLEAKQLRAEILTLLGEDPGVVVTDAVDSAQGIGLRMEQIRMEVRANINDGKKARARNDYDRAIGEFSIAKTKIDLAPYAIDWGGLDDEVTRLLDDTQQERDAAEKATIQDQREQAFRIAQEEERVARDRDQQIVDNIVAEAAAAFEARRFDRAQDLAEKALNLDRRHDKAQEIRDAAFRAGREKVKEDYVQAKQEEFRNWRESLEELRIPYTDVLTLPDREAWLANSKLRTGRRGLDLSQRISGAEIQLREDLRSTVVKLPEVEDEEDLNVLIDMIRDFTGMPLIVDPAASDAVIDNGVVFTFNLANDLTVEQALNRITAIAGEDVTWTVRFDAVFITTREKAAGAPIPYLHDVQDLIFSITDFTGPRIDRLRLLNELEDDDGGGPWGGILESERLIEIDELVTLVTDNVSTDAWENEGVTIEAGEGFILVTQTPEIQQQVKDFLEDLRRFNSSLVTIEAKFMEVGESWIQEIGTDFRGLDDRILEDVTNGLEDMASLGLDNGGSGIDGTNAAGQPSAGFFFDDGADGAFAATAQNFFTTGLGQRLSNLGGLSFQLSFFDDAELSLILRAVEKSEQFQIVNSQTLSVHNTQRAYVTVINQQAYIQDFDVEVAQLQSVADPQINVLHEGVVLDVRPTIGHDRKWLTLEVQPTVARVVSLRNFSTTLGGNTSPVEFQLPELEVQSVNTSAYLPDGGSLLLGGLSRVRNVERRAEVPWIANVPILGFLFKSEGYNDERESLMILIKAWISDIREEVEKELEGKY